MEIYSKSLLTTIKGRINVNNIVFSYEYQIIFYTDNIEWKMDMYELVDILEIEIKLPSETKIINEYPQIKKFIDSYRDIGVDYFGIISNLLDEEIKAFSEVELKKLNKYE